MELSKIFWAAILFSNIFIRKYASSEPTISSVGSEQGPYFPSGEFQSRVIDTGEKGSRWGQISWGENLPAGTDIKIKVRTGDTATPDGSWSSWYPSSGWYEVNTGTPIGCPRARYIQYLSSFTTTVSTQTPQLTEVNIQYATNTATAPNLVSPADGSWSDSTPVFDWDFVDNEADTQIAYQIQLSTDINFGVINYSTGPYSSAYSSMTWPADNPIDGGTYWWRVRTQDSYEKWSVWSSTYQIKIDTIPPSVSIVWIRADSENQITLEGSATDSGGGLPADAWWFEETTGNPGGSDSTVWESTSVFTDSGLSKNTQYTYRMKARDIFGNESDWCSPVTKWTLPAVWRENATTRTGPNAFGASSNSDWTWQIPVKGGQPVTVTAYVRYNSSYGSAAKPKLILSNLGVNSSAQMTAGADTWEKLTVSGTPSSDGVLLLRFLAYSTNPGAEVYIDDIQVSQ